ncbi:tetratricopeptide repeat protein [Methylobacterium sp. EM32]|uniref:tetratricopeptide repeat protein n=1 Tax=Methylobacterium sp. EM32 TaxID=3163481 RepID=UPI0033A357B5
MTSFDPYEAVKTIDATLAEGRFEKAVLDYERHQFAIDAWDAGGVAFRIGNILEELGDTEQAERLYRNAVAANPGMTPYKQNLAAILFEAKRYSEAKPFLEEIVRETTDAYDLRSICLEWLSAITQQELRPNSTKA